MFEDPLCSLFKFLSIHGVDVARPCGRSYASVQTLVFIYTDITYIRTNANERPCRRKYVYMDASILPLGNFIIEAIVCPSHKRPNGHRPTVCPSVIVCVTTLARTAKRILKALYWQNNYYIL